MDGTVQTKLRSSFLPLLLPEVRAPPSRQEPQVLRSQETSLPQSGPGPLPRVLLEQRQHVLMIIKFSSNPGLIISQEYIFTRRMSEFEFK